MQRSAFREAYEARAEIVCLRTKSARGVSSTAVVTAVTQELKHTSECVCLGGAVIRDSDFSKEGEGAVCAKSLASCHKGRNYNNAFHSKIKGFFRVCALATFRGADAESRQVVEAVLYGNVMWSLSKQASLQQAAATSSPPLLLCCSIDASAGQ